MPDVTVACSKQKAHEALPGCAMNCLKTTGAKRFSKLLVLF